LPRFTFKKTERLSSLKAIEQLYRQGASFYNPHFKCVFLFVEEDLPAPCQVVFSVPKRNFKRAVDRNLLKRRMREAYRQNKEQLYQSLTEKHKKMHLLVTYTSREILPYEDILESLVKAIKSLARKAGN
jgi:ribonuclease P protein component